MPFLHVSFNYSISCMLLINKPNESRKNSKKFERNALSTPKSLIISLKENNIAPAKTNAPVSQTSSECLKLTIRTYRMRSKELKMKLRQLQEEISKATLPVSANLSNDFKSIILETDQRKNSLKFFLGGAAKISTIF